MQLECSNGVVLGYYDDSQVITPRDGATLIFWNGMIASLGRVGTADPTPGAPDTRPWAAPSNASPRTVYPPRLLIQTLFTAAEQQALYKAAQTPDGWKIAMFISLVTATPVIDITNSEFVADIGVVQAAGLLTAPRAAQILAGTPAPTS